MGIRPSPTLEGWGAPAGKPSFADVQVLDGDDERTLIRMRCAGVDAQSWQAWLMAHGVSVLGGPRLAQPTEQRRGGRLYIHREGVVLRHPFRSAELRVQSALPRGFAAVLHEDSMDEELWTALAARLPCLLDSDTDCLRLLSGSAEGVPGLTVEKYADVIVLTVQPDKVQKPGRKDAVGAARSWYRRVFGEVRLHQAVSNRKAASEDESRDEFVEAAPGDAEVVVRERGLSFITRPMAAASPGLFLDQRDNRQWVRRNAGGGAVLNAFAYTCGFSVAAAAGGAAQTVSVDVSNKHLEWGRRNFAANGIDPAGHVFIRSDVFDYCKRAARQGRRFDLIILDPPTFAHLKRPRRSFSIIRDLPELIAGAVGILVPGGRILISTNCRKLSVRFLEDSVRTAAAGRRFRVVARPALPPDFAADRDHAKSIIGQFA